MSDRHEAAHTARFERTAMRRMLMNGRTGGMAAKLSQVTGGERKQLHVKFFDTREDVSFGLGTELALCSALTPVYTIYIRYNGLAHRLLKQTNFAQDN